MAKGLSPQEVAEKHLRRTQAAVPDMIKGVNSVTANPAQQAIAKKDKLVSRWNESVQNGKWERGLGRVSLDDWKKSMTEKGANRVAAGLQASQQKMVDFYGELLPFQADLSAKVAKMPDLTIEDSINRAATFIRGMAEFRRSKSR